MKGLRMNKKRKLQFKIIPFCGSNQNATTAVDVECDVDFNTDINDDFVPNFDGAARGTTENLTSSVSSTNSFDPLKLYPDIWSEEQWKEKTNKNKWLICNNGYLGCQDCKTVKSLTIYKSHGLNLSQEWINCTISYNGQTKEQQLKSLRTKISAHVLSKAHKKVERILNEAKNQTIENAAVLKPCTEKSTLQNKETKLSSTIKLFNIAYYIAKNDRPFSDYEELVNLQIKNDIDLGNTLHSRYSCTEIIKHISDEFKKRLIEHILKNERKVSIIIDESTSLGKESVLVIYIKTFLLEDTEECLFFDLINLPNQNAVTIVELLLAHLASYGITEAYLQKHLLCFVSDGANEMLGKSTVVGILLKEKLKAPDILLGHCLNHKLELAVGDISQLRTQISTSNVSSLMFIKLNGPPLKEWAAISYVESWIIKHRSADDTRTRKMKDVDVKRREVWKLF